MRIGLAVGWTLKFVLKPLREFSVLFRGNQRCEPLRPSKTNGHHLQDQF